MKDRYLAFALVAVGGALLIQKADLLDRFHVVVHPATVITSDFRQIGQDVREVMIDERFAVTAGEQLTVDIEHSDLIIEHGSNSEAHVRVVLEADNMDRARTFFEALNFDVHDSSGGVSVTAKRRNQRNWNWNSTGKMHITAYVTVPKEFDYDLSLSHGDAKLPDSRGSSTIVMSHGDLELGGINGASIQIKLSHGDLSAGALVGDKVTLSASHGNVEVNSIEATSIDAKLSHGDVRIDAVSGAINIDNSHGDISVRFTENAGSRFSNSHGDINIVAGNRLSANIDFRGDDVNIASNFGFDGSVKESRAEGRINGGGADLIARTSHGSVTLRRR